MKTKLNQPLRYRVSSWRQLPDCMSNTSRQLHIHVADIYYRHDFSGFRISIDHEMFGTLYAVTLNAKGSIVYEADHECDQYTSTQAILAMIRKYGFLVDYSPMDDLPSAQIEYLISLRDLKYDKIRVLNVWKTIHGEQQFTQYIVGFKVANHEYWLNNDYSPSETEFINALVDGSAINVTKIGREHNFNWDWLTYVANIDDIIKQLAGDPY